jgi:hypothetical protein
VAKPTSTIPSKRKLRRFLDDLYKFLGDTATKQSDRFGRPLFYAKLSKPIADAWLEFEKSFDKAAEFAKVDALSDLDLRQSGLIGKQLDAKLAVVAHHRKKFLQLGGAKWLKKLIDAFDTLLESILKAAGISEAIKELKEVLSDAADDEEHA